MSAANWTSYFQGKKRPADEPAGNSFKKLILHRQALLGRMKTVFPNLCSMTSSQTRTETKKGVVNGPTSATAQANLIKKVTEKPNNEIKSSLNTRHSARLSSNLRHTWKYVPNGKRFSVTDGRRRLNKRKNAQNVASKFRLLKPSKHFDTSAEKNNLETNNNTFCQSKTAIPIQKRVDNNAKKDCLNKDPKLSHSRTIPEKFELVSSLPEIKPTTPMLDKSSVSQDVLQHIAINFFSSHSLLSNSEQTHKEKIEKSWNRDILNAEKPLIDHKLHRGSNDSEELPLKSKVVSSSFHSRRSVLDNSEGSVDSKEKAISSNPFLSSLDESTIANILTNYSDVLPKALECLRQCAMLVRQQSTNLSTASSSNTPLPLPMSSQRSASVNPFEVHVKTDLNSFSISPVLKTKNIGGLSNHVSSQKDIKENVSKDTQSGLNYPKFDKSCKGSACAVVVSDKEEFSEESSSDESDSKINLNLEIIRCRKAIGLTTYKPAEIRPINMESSEIHNTRNDELSKPNSSSVLRTEYEQYCGKTLASLSPLSHSSTHSHKSANKTCTELAHDGKYDDSSNLTSLSSTVRRSFADADQLLDQTRNVTFFSPHYNAIFIPKDRSQSTVGMESKDTRNFFCSKADTINNSLVETDSNTLLNCSHDMEVQETVRLEQNLLMKPFKQYPGKLAKNKLDSNGKKSESPQGFCRYLKRIASSKLCTDANPSDLENFHVSLESGECIDLPSYECEQESIIICPDINLSDDMFSINHQLNSQVVQCSSSLLVEDKKRFSDRISTNDVVTMNSGLFEDVVTGIQSSNSSFSTSPVRVKQSEQLKIRESKFDDESDKALPDPVTTPVLKPCSVVLKAEDVVKKVYLDDSTSANIFSYWARMKQMSTPSSDADGNIFSRLMIADVKTEFSDSDTEQIPDECYDASSAIPSDNQPFVIGSISEVKSSDTFSTGESELKLDNNHELSIASVPANKDSYDKTNKFPNSFLNLEAPRRIVSLNDNLSNVSLNTQATLTCLNTDSSNGSINTQPHSSARNDSKTTLPTLTGQQMNQFVIILNQGVAGIANHPVSCSCSCDSNKPYQKCHVHKSGKKLVILPVRPRLSEPSRIVLPEKPLLKVKSTESLSGATTSSLCAPEVPKTIVTPLLNQLTHRSPLVSALHVTPAVQPGHKFSPKNVIEALTRQQIVENQSIAQSSSQTKPVTSSLMQAIPASISTVSKSCAPAVTISLVQSSSPALVNHSSMASVPQITISEPGSSTANDETNAILGLDIECLEEGLNIVDSINLDEPLEENSKQALKAAAVRKKAKSKKLSQAANVVEKTCAVKRPSGTIYLDYNATTPVDSSVATLVYNTLKEDWGNPSSSHATGVNAAQVVNLARSRVAKMLCAKPENIFFTSGGTESNNLAIWSAVKHYRQWQANLPLVLHPLREELREPHIIVSNIEHDSVKKAIDSYGSIIDVTVVDWETMPQGVIQNIRKNTCLISVMLANNETGIILPVAQITRLLENEIYRARSSDHLFRLLVHSDASQCVGKIPVEVDSLGVDYLTITGHKFYGPRVGALYVKEDAEGFLPVYPQLYGGGQERGIRPGTENTAMVAGLGLACQLVTENLPFYMTNFKKLRVFLERSLRRHFGRLVKLNVLEPCKPNDPETCSKIRPFGNISSLIYARLPNTCSISLCCPQVTSREVLELCPGVQCSVGAACHSDTAQAHDLSVLGRHGVCSFHAARTIRLSIGRETTIVDIDRAVVLLRNALHQALGEMPDSTGEPLTPKL